MGAERLVQMIVGASNLRETALFPRDIKRLFP
jgi:aspartyl/asparaginyl-tRNA synthetase